MLRTLALAFLVLAGAISTAGGEQAVVAPLAIRSLLLDSAVAGQRLVVVGERGHILVSDDNGQSWRQASVPTRALLTAVHMHDAETGWAVGHDAVILRTRDAGASWQMVHHAPEEERPLLDVWFRDADHGFAIGAYGYFLETRDGGDSWQDRTISDDDYHLNALAAVAGNEPVGQRLYIAGEAGALYRSDDGGRSWQALESPYGGSWLAALALERDRILVAGLRGHLFRSNDGGLTWIKLDSGTRATLTGLLRLQGGSVLVTGLEGIVLSSHNGGHDASLARLPSRQGITGAVELAGGDVLLTGEFGVLRRSEVN